jgi:hypothetical protein
LLLGESAANRRAAQGLGARAFKPLAFRANLPVLSGSARPAPTSPEAALASLLRLLNLDRRRSCLN